MDISKSETPLKLVCLFIISVGILAAPGILVRGRTYLHQTTLRTAWGWAVAAVSAWTITWIADPCATIVSPSVADHVWYACAVLALCPPMAVLGSRRPGTRVWMWFILFPMLLALAWPLVAVRLQGSELRGVQLELPQLCAFVLILVMGVGNYLGTRFTLSALLYAAAVLASVVSMSSIAPSWLKDRQYVRLGCSATMALAIISIWSSRRPIPVARFDRLWFDFFDTFGVVWGRRIQDRMNYLAHKESWPFRLELDGFVEVDQGRVSDRSQSNVTDSKSMLRHVSNQTPPALVDYDSRIEHTFRWLLRRFVDPPWIDRRIGSANSDIVVDEIIDS